MRLVWQQWPDFAELILGEPEIQRHETSLRSYLKSSFRLSVYAPGHQQETELVVAQLEKRPNSARFDR